MSDLGGLADRVAEQLRNGEFFAEEFAEGATVWHNFDERDYPVEFIVGQATLQKQIAADLRAEDVRIHLFAGGFCLQQVVCGTLGDGTAFRIPGAIVCDVVGGQIAKAWEYVTESAAAPLMAATQAAMGRALFDQS